MQLIRGRSAIRRQHRGSVLTIGNYDGVHIGHRYVISQVTSLANDHQTDAAVMTFEPYPREFFQGDAAPPRISNLSDKILSLEACGVDRVFCLRFNTALAQTEAEDFVRIYLVDALDVCHVVVGDDFRFGRKRTGDVNLLKDMAGELGFGVSVARGLTLDSERVSSSRIRRCLANGDMEQAARLLGSPYSISGRVAHGDRRGRTWGFPTANIFIRHGNPPVRGVFAVDLDRGDGGACLQGVANVGMRPTVGGTRLLLEVHLLDFDGDLYGQRVRIFFKHRIRDEMRFESFDALKDRIYKDTGLAREYFNNAV